MLEALQTAKSGGEHTETSSVPGIIIAGIFKTHGLNTGKRNFYLL
jgi:hypothetical protein